MITYRISDCKYIDDLSGKGAAMYGGRWNSRDTYIVYTAQSGALALLEAVVHAGRIPAMDYCLVTVEIPDNSIEVIEIKDLPPNWYSSPPPDYLKKIGDDFIKANKYLALRLPSVLMIEEHNYLLNPAHKDFKKVQIISKRSIRIDDRLF